MGIFNFFKKKDDSKNPTKSMSFEDKLKIVAESERLNNLGVLEFRRGNINGAKNYYEQALMIMPTNDDSLINLASCYNKLGDYSKAIELCKEAIKVDPNRAEGYRTIGDSFFNQSKMSEVVKWYRESAARGDQSTHNWLIKSGYSLKDENSFLSDLLVGNNNPEVGEYIFCSKKHQRYENGVAVMGLQEGHIRNVKIEKNISGDSGYSVTVLNPNPNPFTGSVTMATKPMKIINKQSGEIELRGYGNDRLSGIPFSDYGISVFFENNNINKIILHMHDRNVNIEYLP